MEKAKYGKMRQVKAINGSQMVVKLRDSYYRRKQEHKVKGHKLSSLLYTITTDFSTIKNGTPLRQSAMLVLWLDGFGQLLRALHDPRQSVWSSS